MATPYTLKGTNLSTALIHTLYIIRKDNMNSNYLVRLVFTCAIFLLCVCHELYGQDLRIVYKSFLSIPYAEQIEKDKKRNPHAISILNRMYKYESQIDDYVIEFELIHTDNKSIFKLVPSDTMGVSIKQYDDGEFKFSLVTRDDVCYKDFSTDLLAVSRFRNNNYCVQDEMPKFNWTIMSDKKDILGFSCTLAKCVYQGKPVFAWFTDEIPVSNGPMEYAGLPGLILELKTWDNVSTFVAVELNYISKTELSHPIAHIFEDVNIKQCYSGNYIELDAMWQAERSTKEENKRRARRNR